MRKLHGLILISFMLAVAIQHVTAALLEPMEREIFAFAATAYATGLQEDLFLLMVQGYEAVMRMGWSVICATTMASLLPPDIIDKESTPSAPACATAQ